MATPDTPMSEQESLKLISEMIQKAKTSYHETGVSALLWGSSVFIAGVVTFLQIQYSFKLPFDIWLLVLLALIPQVIISSGEAKRQQFRSHDQIAVDYIWIIYGATIFGLVIYQNFVPSATQHLIKAEGWTMLKHSADTTLADEPLTPFAPSFTSVFLLIYALPTLFTGLLTKFRPMIIGALFTYIFFGVSLFTAVKYDMLLASAAALVCWFIPGIILRKRYLKSKATNV